MGVKLTSFDQVWTRALCVYCIAQNGGGGKCTRVGKLVNFGICWGNL